MSIVGCTHTEMISALHALQRGAMEADEAMKVQPSTRTQDDYRSVVRRRLPLSSERLSTRTTIN